MSKAGPAVLAFVLAAACGSSPEPQFPEQSVAADPQTNSDMAARPVSDTPSPEAGRPIAPAGARAGGESKAHAGAFTTDDGKKVDLAKLTETQGAIVIFYRGHWCKQCRKQLVEMESIRADLEQRGFKVYAVSVDAPDTSAELKQRLKLGFTLLSDKGGMSITSWGVYTQEHDLARPAVFVIAPGGAITYRYVSDSPRDRPSPQTLLGEATKARPPEK